MVAIKNILFLASAVAAVVLPRDAKTVLADLQTIDTDTKKLTSDTNAWTGGAAGAIPIQQDESKVDNDIKKATSDANASAVASSTDAQNIINYINNTLEPDIKKAVSAIIAKKSQFQSAGLSSTVKNDFTTLKKDADALGAALIAKAPSAQQSGAKAALAKIDADLQNGINAFS